jgi:hypothetical protein
MASVCSAVRHRPIAPSYPYLGQSDAFLSGFPTTGFSMCIIFGTVFWWFLILRDTFLYLGLFLIVTKWKKHYYWKNLQFVPLWQSSLWTPILFDPLTSEINPSAQRCLTRFFTGNFASWTVHFVSICVKNQQIQQLFIQFINYVWYLLHVSALYCHLHGAFLVPSEWWSIQEQSIEYCGWACCV